jgi:hypothetical protein
MNVMSTQNTVTAAIGMEEQRTKVSDDDADKNVKAVF